MLAMVFGRKLDAQGAEGAAKVVMAVEGLVRMGIGR